MCRNFVAKFDSGTASWQNDLSVSYARLAEAFKKVGKTRALTELNPRLIIRNAITLSNHR
jgi:hypothetical protein